MLVFLPGVSGGTPSSLAVGCMAELTPFFTITELVMLSSVSTRLEYYWWCIIYLSSSTFLGRSIGIVWLFEFYSFASSLSLWTLTFGTLPRNWNLCLGLLSSAALRVMGRDFFFGTLIFWFSLAVTFISELDWYLLSPF